MTNNAKLVFKFLKLSGPSEELFKWREAMLDSNTPIDTPYFLFNKVVQEPKDIGGKWYEWRMQNWGCKWDIAEEDERGVEPTLNEDDQIEYSFDTPWNPPFELLDHITSMFPEIRVELAYYEPGAVFAGLKVWSGSEKKWVLEKEYSTEREVNKFVFSYFSFNLYDEDDLVDFIDEE